MDIDLHHPEVVDVVRHALAEDIGSGDITTNATVDADLMATGRFVARQPMTVCGVELIELIFAELGGVDFIGTHMHSGERAAEGDVLATVRGKARTLLTGERVALHTHLAVREDALDLYGFADDDERRLFEQLIGVSGVGPRMALAICVISSTTGADGPRDSACARSPRRASISGSFFFS